jgi:hypothetical protein
VVSAVPDIVLVIPNKTTPRDPAGFYVVYILPVDGVSVVQISVGNAIFASIVPAEPFFSSCSLAALKTGHNPASQSDRPIPQPSGLTFPGGASGITKVRSPGSHVQKREPSTQSTSVSKQRGGEGWKVP